MLLYLMRHGIAVERGAPGLPSDRERPLTPKGVKRVRQAARGLERLGVAPGVILCSPFLRAAQTAHLAAKVLGVSSRQVRVTDALEPDARPERLLEELGPLRSRDVLCAGHAPHLDRLLAHLTGSSREVVTSLGKAGVACLELRPPRKPELRWLAEPTMLRRVRRRR